MIDLHLHTTASDGRLAPADLVRLAAASGLRTIAVTDHDTTAGLAEARAEAERAGLRLVDGIEITAVEGRRDVHVLGYFFDPGDDGLLAFLRDQRADRLRRIREMSVRLASLGAPIDLEPQLRSAARQAGRSIGRPLVADALVQAGHVRDRAEAFDRLLAVGRPAFVPRRGAPVAEVIRMVRAAGGVTSLAHPGLTGIDDAIERFAAAGLDALEVRHADHDPVTEARYRRMAAGLGLAVSGGSDFHADPSHHAPALGIVTVPLEDFAALHARAAGRRVSAG